VGAPQQLVETQDVLIEPLPSTVLEGSVYRIQMGSFPTRSQAATLRTALREELDDDLVIWREAGSGRFAVRLGSYPSEAGARARMRELVELGFETVELAVEATTTPRPRALVLRPVGQAAIQTSSLTLLAVPQLAGAWVEVDGKPYRGYVEIFVNASNTFTIVNVVNLEDYLKGVVPAELSPKAFPEKEAIKAQAIAARTYAVKRRGQFEADGYDICATPACQVYRGVSVEEPMSNEAVRETKGEVLTFQGKLVEALYTSTCGGRTENAENIFTSAQPYLVSRACFLESRGNVVRSSNSRPLSLEAAALSLLGVISSGASGASSASVSVLTARGWMERVVAQLGQAPCFSADAPSRSTPVDVVALARLLGEGLCWERRLPFLMSSEDAVRIVPLGPVPGLSEDDRRHLAFAIQEDLVRPDPAGIEPGRALTEREVQATLYRLIVERGEPPLHAGTLERIEAGRLFITDDTLGDKDNEISTFLAPQSYLFRKAGASTYYADELVLLAGDNVLFHMGDGGVDMLVLVSEGASFDRSSRMSHWVVRKSNEDLSREVSVRRRIGEIVELRPKRYGRSGRIVELEIIGTSGSLDLEGLAVRRALGIRENLFFIDAQRRPDGTVESWVFTGRGWGHGVGMCQVGAYGMAAAGYGYQQILSHYYTGTSLSMMIDKDPRSP
jgi:stage II sporulation protein D